MRRERGGKNRLRITRWASQLIHKPAPGYLYATRLPISGLTWLTTVHCRPVVSPGYLFDASCPAITSFPPLSLTLLSPFSYSFCFITDARCASFVAVLGSFSQFFTVFLSLYHFLLSLPCRRIYDRQSVTVEVFDMRVMERAQLWRTESNLDFWPLVPQFMCLDNECVF